VAVNHPPSGFGGSTPSRRTRFDSRSAIGKATWFSARRGGFDSLTGYSSRFFFQVGGCSVSPHKADIPVRVRDLGLCRRAGARACPLQRITLVLRPKKGDRHTARKRNSWCGRFFQGREPVPFFLAL
jgi:hypothetical protein